MTSSIGFWPTPSRRSECEEIAALVEGTPLAECANARWFFKEEGTTSGFGDITGQYALDMTLLQVEGVEEPVPVQAVGRVLYLFKQ